MRRAALRDLSHWPGVGHETSRHGATLVEHLQTFNRDRAEFAVIMRGWQFLDLSDERDALPRASRMAGELLNLRRVACRSSNDRKIGQLRHPNPGGLLTDPVLPRQPRERLAGVSQSIGCCGITEDPRARHQKLCCKEVAPAFDLHSLNARGLHAVLIGV